MANAWEHRTPSDTDYVIVSWRDIRDVSGWDSDDTTEIRCARALATGGWLVYEGPDAGEPESRIAIIAKTYDYEEARWADFTVFPFNVIKSIVPA